MNSLNSRADHRASCLRPSEVFPFLQKLKILLLHGIYARNVNIMFIVAMRFFYLIFILHSLAQEGQHLATEIRSAGKSKVDGFSSFFGDRFYRFCGHMSLIVQFAESVKGFICSRVGANHALCGTVVMSEGILWF